MCNYFRMPKIPYKPKKKNEEEVLSFESFCSSGSGHDSLTLNDNINYQLYFEKRGSGESSTGQTSKNDGSHSELHETSLSAAASMQTSFKSKTTDDAENQGKFYPQNGKYAFLNRMKHSIPKRTDSVDNSSDKGLKYERFSDSRNINAGFCEKLPGLGSGILVLIVVCVLCVVVWWGVWGVVGGAWGEEHYRRLWERAHPQHNQNHHTHYSPSVIVHQQLERLDPIVPFEPKYHDHNNLSTKNKNASEIIKQKHRLDVTEIDSKKNTSPMESSSDRPFFSTAIQCTTVKDEFRFDCYPEAGASEDGCIKRGCCWIPHYHDEQKSNSFKINLPNVRTSIGLPYCFYPGKYGNYHFTNITETRHGMLAYLEMQFPSSYPGDISTVAIHVKYLSDDTLQIKVKINCFYQSIIFKIFLQTYMINENYLL